MVKNCTGEGALECRTEFETSCSTKYRDDSLVDTSCIKIPVSFCGEGCVTHLGAEECQDKTTDVLHDIPGCYNLHDNENDLMIKFSEEECDLSPMKVCKPMTKLIPSLKPSKQCTQVLKLGLYLN